MHRIEYTPPIMDPGNHQVTEYQNLLLHVKLRNLQAPDQQTRLFHYI